MSSEMNINRQNYESWFLDYHEGTLTAAQAEELFAFLDQHPELRGEFESFEMIQLDAEEEFPSFDKSTLLKTTGIDATNLDEWLISEMEGRLSEEELNQLHDYLHLHPAEKTRRTQFAATRLEAGEEINPSARLLYTLEPIGTHNIDLWLIAETEGQLHLQQRTLLQEFLTAHPSYIRDRELYAATHLSVSAEETYQHKQALYKKAAPVLPLQPVAGAVSGNHGYRSLMRVAAVILLLLGAWIGFRLFLQPTSNEQHRAETQQPEIVTPENRLLSSPETLRDTAALQPSTDGTSTPQKDRVIIKNPKQENKRKTPVLRRRYTPGGNLAAGTPVIQQEEEIPMMTPKRSNGIYTEEPFVYAERRYTPKATPYYNTPNEPPSIRTALQLNTIREAVSNEINLAAGEEILQRSKQPGRLTVGSKIIRFAAKAIGKISGEKVKVRTVFNPVTGKLGAYEVQTKNKSWAKQF